MKCGTFEFLPLIYVISRHMYIIEFNEQNLVSSKYLFFVWIIKPSLRIHRGVAVK